MTEQAIPERKTDFGEYDTEYDVDGIEPDYDAEETDEVDEEVTD